MNEYKIKIGGLDCPNCTAKLERGIKNNKNFFDVSLSFVNKLLILKSELSLEEVKYELNKIINKVEPDAYIEEKEHTVPGHNMDVTAFPMTGRAYSGSYTDITATEFINKLKAGELAAGGYNITDKALTFDDPFSGKEVSASGIFVKASKGVKLDEVEGLRIKELTVEVTGDTDALITTNSIRDVRLLGWQVSYSGNDFNVELVKTEGTASAGTAGCRIQQHTGNHFP